MGDNGFVLAEGGLHLGFRCLQRIPDMPGRGQKQFAFLAQEHADIAAPHHGDAQELCLLVHSGLKADLKEPPESGDAGWQTAHAYARQWLASRDLRQVQGQPTDTAVFKIEQGCVG